MKAQSQRPTQNRFTKVSATFRFLPIVLSVALILAGCASNPEKEEAHRQADAQKVQQHYAGYSTPQLQLKRQEIAATIPSSYWGYGIAGAIQAGQIDSRKKQVAEIDRELLRRAESGDRTGQQKVTFIVSSDPPGAKIEADGKFLGNTPKALTFTGNFGTPSTIRVIPTTLDRPILGCTSGMDDADGKLTADLSLLDVVCFVSPNSSASKMGLMKGDQIIGINGVTLPAVRGTLESSKSYEAAAKEQMANAGFGGDLTLKIWRDGKEMELRGHATEQLTGVYYVQTKTIQPMQFDGQVILFDMHIPSATPIALNSTGEVVSSPKGSVFTGTGFAIAEGGYILTCQHVVGSSSEIEIRDGTGAQHKAKIVASDSGNDLCLLLAESLNLKPIPSAPPNSVGVGETIFCLGFPMEGGNLQNKTPVAGNGVVASLRGLKGDPRHLQVTVPINPGNSGGPILDAHGRWVAVASHKLNDFYYQTKTGQVPQGVNFAVKGTLVIPLFDSIPEVKLPVADTKETISLEDANKRFSESIVLITAKD